MLKLIVLLLNLLLFVDRGESADPSPRDPEKKFTYPNAYKPNEEVTITKITCKLNNQGTPLSTLVTVNNPNFVKHESKQVGADKAVHINFPTEKLILIWIFEQQQDIEIELKNGGETVGVLKTHIGNIMFVANHEKKGLAFHDKRDSKKELGKCHFETSHMDSQSYIDTEWIGKGLADFSAFYEIIYVPGDGLEDLLYRSEVSITPSDHNTRVQTDHNWKPARIEKEIFDPTLPGSLRIDVFDADDETECFFMGSHTFPTNELEKVKGKPLPILSNKNAYQGTVILKTVHHGQSSSMSTAFDQGWTLKFTVVIDFTGSNTYGKLHSFDSEGRNQYSIALEAVGNVIAQYDDDNKFPVLGYGAGNYNGERLPFLFYLTTKEDAEYKEKDELGLSEKQKEKTKKERKKKKENAEIEGIEKIVATYKKEVPNIPLASPTEFLPIINTVTKWADEDAGDKEYQVLLILTDGVIDDPDETKAKITDSSDKAMSVIIVGVGDRNFKLMEELDGDNKELVKRKPGTAFMDKIFAPGARDIVQFVAMKHFLTKDFKIKSSTKGTLAQHVLEELPEQITIYAGYMAGVLPNSPTNPSMPPMPAPAIQDKSSSKKKSSLFSTKNLGLPSFLGKKKSSKS